MKNLLPLVLMAVFSTHASAGCISPGEKTVLKLRALLQGSVKVFISHSDLAYGTPALEIQQKSAQRIAELNAESTVLYATQSWVPELAPGFEAYATAAGIERLYDKELCFGAID